MHPPSGHVCLTLYPTLNGVDCGEGGASKTGGWGKPPTSLVLFYRPPELPLQCLPFLPFQHNYFMSESKSGSASAYFHSKTGSPRNRLQQSLFLFSFALRP